MLKKPKSKRRYTDPQVHRPPTAIKEPASAGPSHSPHAYNMQQEPDDEFL